MFHHRVLRGGQLTLLGGHGPDLSPCESTRTYETVSDVGSKFSLGRLILTVSIRRLTNTSCYTQKVLIPANEPWTPVRLCFFKKKVLKTDSSGEIAIKCLCPLKGTAIPILFFVFCDPCLCFLGKKNWSSRREIGRRQGETKKREEHELRSACCGAPPRSSCPAERIFFRCLCPFARISLGYM